MSDGQVAECVPVHFCDLIACPDPKSDIFPVSSPVYQLKNCGVSQTPSFSEKRSASGTLLYEQSKTARMSMERPHVKAVPGSGTDPRRKVRCSKLCLNV